MMRRNGSVCIHQLCGGQKMRCGARSADFSLVRQGDTADIGAYRQQLLL